MLEQSYEDTYTNMIHNQRRNKDVILTNLHEQEKQK